MPKQFFHLDRLGNVDEDTVFELSRSNVHPGGPTHKLDGHGIYDRVGRDDYDFVEQYFPGGLTAHGKNYLYTCIDLSKQVLRNGGQFLELESIVDLLHDPRAHRDWVKELVFELVRQDGYSDSISRFQSVFGASTQQGLQKWMSLQSVDAESGDIYKVATDSRLIVDASLLDTPEENQQPIKLAEDLKHQAQRYWSGDITENAVREVLLEPPVEVKEYIRSVSV